MSPRAGTRRRHGSGGPVPYDFRRPTTLSREHSRTLQIAMETFSRQATTVLTSTLRAVCQVGLANVEQLTYTEYVQSLAPQTYMCVLSVEPVPGAGVMEIPIAAAMAFVDHLLGGPGSGEQPDRPLTEIENALVQGLVERLLSEMRYAFESLVVVDPVVTGVEYNPQFAQAAAASDAVVVSTLDLRIGEIDHIVTVCLPFPGLLPYLTAAGGSGAVSEREQEQRRIAADVLGDSFGQVPVDVSVRFRATSIDPSVLMELVPGDVVRLAHPAAAPLDVTSGDVVFAHATPGARGRRLACLVVAPPASNASPQEYS
ncbi:MAG: flagellar motor switch protein FliM [Nocardioidaceae bacterium]